MYEYHTPDTLAGCQPACPTRGQYSSFVDLLNSTDDDDAFLPLTSTTGTVAVTVPIQTEPEGGVAKRNIAREPAHYQQYPQQQQQQQQQQHEMQHLGHSSRDSSLSPQGSYESDADRSNDDDTLHNLVCL